MRPYIEQLRVLLIDLYLVTQEDPFLCLGMSFSDGEWNSRSRYNPLGLSKQVIDLVKRLAEAGLVRVSAESYAGPGAVGNRTTRIQAGSALLQRFAALEVDPRAIRAVPTECIVLKDEADKLVEYEDTEETRRMRSELTAYNDLLARTFIDIPSLEDPWIVRQDSAGQDIRVGIAPRYQHVRRIFSRSSWEMNGRFYGPWWQGLSSEWRSQIFINDTPTVEIDFKAIHPQILAAQQGVELPDDPYVLPPGQFPGVEEWDQRDLVKQLVLTALNARNVRSASSAFRNDFPTGHLAKGLSNETLQQVVEAFSRQVPALADSLCSDAGIRLMYTDSRIIERVINHFTREGLPVLTVHDSVITPYTHSTEVQEVMRQAAAEVVGRELPVEAEHRGQDFETLREAGRGEGYLVRLAAWEAETGREVLSLTG